MIYTQQDIIDHLVDFVGGGPSDQVLRDCRRAVEESYREVVNAHRWPYYYHHGRILTVVPYRTGTIQYIHTGGAYERMLVLSGGVWPTWAAYAYIRISAVVPENYVNYRCAARISDTVLTLDDQVNPEMDLPAGATFIMYQDTYLLPSDYIEQDQALYERNFGGMTYTAPKNWLYENRYIFAQGVPRRYTISGDPQYPGRLVIRVYPWPTDSRTIDFIYKRRPRPLTIPSVPFTGSVSVNGTTVTAAGTPFVPTMVGSVLRLSSTARPPSSQFGSAAGYNPAIVEARVTAWTNPGSVMIDAPSAMDLSGVGGAVVEPIDMEQGAMINAMLRCCEKNISKIRNLKDKGYALDDWRYALDQAKSAASPSFMSRSPADRDQWHMRLRDHPVGPDQP